MTRPAIVGERLGRRGLEPGGALDGPAGARLAALAGLALPELLALSERHNLLPSPGDRWDAASAAGEASALAWRLQGRLIVLLGARVERAFRRALGERRLLPPLRPTRVAGLTVLPLPHPSGRCRRLNDPALRAEVGRLLRGALGVVASGRHGQEIPSEPAGPRVA